MTMDHLIIIMTYELGLSNQSIKRVTSIIQILYSLNSTITVTELTDLQL